MAKRRAPRKAQRKTEQRRPGLVSLAALLVVGASGAGLLAAGSVSDQDATETSDSDTTTTAPTTTTTTTAPPTTTTTAPTTTTTARPPAFADGTLESGEEGVEVADLQTRLGALGFWLGTPDGRYGQLTRQAVMAFQKANGLGRDGVAGPATLAAVSAAARTTPRDANGPHLEIDLDRQVLLVVQGGQVQWVLNTSTGNGEAYAAPGGGSAVAATPRGTFAVEREIDGIRQAPLGRLYRPKYFHGGIAIHGAGQIPAHPASHGCARVTNAAMDMLWSSGVAPLGTRVLVY